MTHRDELLALQARVEAQSRELDEAKSEISLLRAAHAQKTREAEALRRELSARHGEDAPPDGTSASDDSMRERRSFGFGAALIGGVALTSAMMILAGGPCGAHRTQIPRATAVDAFERVGHVAVGSDPAAAIPGEVCTVRREPALVGGGFDCRVEVRCGDRTLYGASPETGFMRCGGRRVMRDRQFTATDGDPKLELDLRSGTVIIEEQLGLGTQRVLIELAETVD
jgi:hypothetical protein